MAEVTRTRRVLGTSPPLDGSGPAAVAVYAIEGGLWQVVAIAYGRSRAETTVKDIRGLATKLPAVFGEATSGEPVGEPASFFFHDSLRRLSADLERFPLGLIAVGDAVASFNPLHGLGMASAVKQASILADLLAGGVDPAGPAREFMRLNEAAVAAMWKEGAGR
ncbi:hypothetical protein ACFQZ8_04925 [Micromonospora azadirachtae]|uniref:Epoxidase LasC n=1 Tax=Micromonospora azadirachtae TaxID=1970735 RepID=A0ABW2ZX90_9ACTN